MSRISMVGAALAFAALAFTNTAAVASEQTELLDRAARTIEHEADALLQQHAGGLLGGPRRTGSSRRVDRGIRLDDGMLNFDGAEMDASDALRLLAAHGSTGRPIARQSLARAASALKPPVDWDESLRVAFVALLRTTHSTAALEMLDHLDAWASLLPEWLAIRGRAQHDPYHRFTVVDEQRVHRVARIVDDPRDRVRRLAGRERPDGARCRRSGR